VWGNQRPVHVPSLKVLVFTTDSDCYNNLTALMEGCLQRNTTLILHLSLDPVSLCDRVTRKSFESLVHHVGEICYESSHLSYAFSTTRCCRHSSLQLSRFRNIFSVGILSIMLSDTYTNSRWQKQQKQQQTLLEERTLMATRCPKGVHRRHFFS